MSIFRKRPQNDPFEHLLSGNQGQTEANAAAAAAAADSGFLTRVVTQEQEEYKSPFRSTQNVAEAQRRRAKKFPTVSASTGPGSAAELGYKVVDAARKRAKDIAVPRYLQGTDERQRRQLDKLEAKEDRLRYLRESQRIVDVRKGAAAEAEAAAQGEVFGGEVAEEVGDTGVAEEAAGTGVAETEVGETGAAETEAGEAEALGPEAPEVEAPEVEAPGAEALGAAEVEDAEVHEPEVPAPAAEAPESKAAESEAPASDAPASEVPALLPADSPPADVTAAAELAAAERDAAEPAAPATPTPAEPLQPEPLEPEPTRVPPADDDRGALAATAAVPATEPSAPARPVDVSKAPRVPFKSSGLFALWTRADAKGQPVATPDDPEFIVRTDKGYMSKALYDTLQYETQEHDREMATYTKEQSDRYDATAREYQDKLTALQSQVAELEATMEQLQRDTAEKIKVSDTKLSRRMIERNAEHSAAKNVVFKQTENIKAEKLQQKQHVEEQQDGVKAEIEQLQQLKAEVDAEFQQHQHQVDELTAQLDEKLAALDALAARQAETQAELDALHQQREQLEADARAADELHAANQATLESIHNKEYLTQINGIDTQISQALSSLTLIKQETANHRTEFAAITKRLEEERIAHEAKLKREEEERKRLEEERLQRQREELEAKADEQRKLHEEQLRAVQEEHDRQLEEAAQKAADTEAALAREKEERERVERDRTRLQGEQAIQEQQRAKEADDALKAELMAKRQKQAEAMDAADAARSANASASKQRASKSVLASLNNAPGTNESSLYEYETEEEVVTVDN
ncbi:LAFE_0F04456g1_1 [Lachancea fermentati]|uniref:LAFE_0F04456g1_1 n=1 Tax=Lachancea fermentati TaxID=4955 RepID=A0A1G4MF26_LACFM|nr:LAFE_0F04456g1_1 [Lachancea fermentati]